MTSKPDYFYKQSAVIPVRKTIDSFEILLITTRRRKRWIIPKGIIEDDLGSAASAEKEAFEEAGVRGKVDSHLLGTYEYKKWGGVCHVDVFLMTVAEVFDDWPERGERERKWVSLKKAIKAVDNVELSQIMGELENDRIQI